MARRRRGMPVSGWVVLDKPAGLGSTEAVNRVRRAFDAAKAGHAGTLDPDATGVLAIALGEATKCIPVLADAAKGYRFCVRWGAGTDSDDASGAVIETSPLRPGDAAIRAALAPFRGSIMQVPPRVSAVKVAGRRAYDLARRGEEPALAARPLHVARLELIGRPDEDHALFEMTCGKGGYVRSIARDLGRALGCLGHVLWLRREWSGPFRAQEATTLEAIAAKAAAGEAGELLQPPEAALAGLREIALDDDEAARLRQGRRVRPARPLAEGEAAWASHDGRAIALGRGEGGEFRPSRVLNP